MKSISITKLTEYIEYYITISTDAEKHWTNSMPFITYFKK